MLQTVLINIFIAVVFLVKVIKSDEQKFFLSPKELTWDKAEKVRD